MTSTTTRSRPEVLSCANLGEKGQNLRLRMSVVGFATALGANVVLFRLGVDPAWRLVTFFPFLVAFSGALQGLLRTCPMHSVQGTRELDRGGVLPMTDDRRREASRRLGRLVFAASFVLAGLSTLILYLLP